MKVVRLCHSDRGLRVYELEDKEKKTENNLVKSDNTYLETNLFCIDFLWFCATSLVWSKWSKVVFYVFSHKKCHVFMMIWCWEITGQSWLSPRGVHPNRNSALLWSVYLNLSSPFNLNRVVCLGEQCLYSGTFFFNWSPKICSRPNNKI